MSEEDLLQRIEELRKKLNAFALGKSLIDPEVINLSQLLDCLLNQYQTISGVWSVSMKKEESIMIF